MKFLNLIALAGLSVAVFSTHAMAQDTAMANIINNDAQNVGTIEIKQAPDGLLLHVNLDNMPVGKHGFHIHDNGTCEDNADFKMAGGHIGKGDNKHGLMNPDGYEEGDLPNLIVPENGKVEVEFYVDDLKIADADDKNDDEVLLDDNGAAFMIHENADDHMTQPIGGSGARIACGVIK